MKKTIVALITLSGVVSAASVNYDEMSSTLKQNLLYAWDFSTDTKANTGNSTLFSSYEIVEGGGLAIGEVSYAADGKVTKRVDPYVTSLSGVKSSWTLNLDLSNFALSSNQKGAIISLYSDSATAQCNYAMGIQAAGNSGNITLVNKPENQKGFGDNAAFTLDTGMKASEFNGNSITIVSDSTAHTLTLYVDGIKKAQQDNWTSSAITGMQMATYFSGWWQLKGSAEIENFYLFDSALTAEQVKSLQAVPEPTTATLSLLALAGLAARRRRK